MRLRIIALSLVAFLGVSAGMAAAPVSSAHAAVRAVDGWHEEMGMPAGGWAQSQWDHYIKKMTQPMQPGKPRKFYPLTPSTSKFRAFMINTVGSVLGAATPDKWQREQLANKNKYNFSWEKMEQEFHKGGAAGAPQSMDDYTLKKKDWKSKNQDKVPKNVGTPATKANPIRKGINNVGGVALGLTALPIGFAIGNAGLEIFGFEASEGELCSLDDSPARRAAGMVSGVDCKAWDMTVEAIAQANVDTPGGWQSSSSCVHGVCASLSDYVVSPPSWTSYRFPCYSISGSLTGKTVFLNYNTAGSGGGNNIAITAAALSTNGFCGTGKITGGALRIAPTSEITNLKSWYMFGKVGSGDNINGTAAVESDGNPERHQNCSVTGSDGLTYSMSAAIGYKEGSGAIAPPECPTLPDGVVPHNVKLDDGMGNDLYNEPSTQPFKDWAAANPDCTDGSCPLDLLVKTTDGTDIASCFDLGAGCAGWFEAPDKNERFECRYNGKKVDLKECYVYSGVFAPERQSVGSPYSDPETGVWTGGQSSPSAATAGMAQPVQNPDTMRNCLASGWAEFNPVEWVFTPIKCSFEWAFVPRPAVVQLGGVTASNVLEDRAPGQLHAVASNWEFNPSMSGCKKTVSYPSIYPGVPDELVTLWDACEGGAQAQLALWSRWIASIGMVVLVVMVLRRSVAGTVDYKA